MRIYFTGHQGFGNRGSEALIRSIVKIVRTRFPTAEFLVTTGSAELDGRQWKEAAENGVRFVPGPDYPALMKWWGRFYRVFPSVSRLGRPRFTPDRATVAAIREADVVISTGGDPLSLDYTVQSLYWWLGIADTALALGKPVHLWAASAGPFSRDPAVERFAKEHLARYASLAVRETTSLAYLRRLGLKPDLLPDPAFVLDSEPWNFAAGWNEARRDILGFNVSPVIRRFRGAEPERRALDAQIVAFLKRILAETELAIALIPHVDPIAETETDTISDSHYMSQLLALAGGPSDRLRLLPPTLNTAQLKYAIGSCRYMIGGRTHATLAALSQCIPTISIAYSVKAVGINRDLLDGTECVLPTPDVSEATLWNAFRHLQVNETELKALLRRRIPDWQSRAMEGAKRLDASAPRMSKVAESAPEGSAIAVSRPLA